VPVPFFEAAFGDRLERLLELPKGKILASIEPVDAVGVKEILGGHTALFVRCPNTCKLRSLGQLASFIKDLIDKCAGNGGLILVIKMPDKVQIEDMQAMLRSIKEYGRH
jgi:dihydroorotate dehydrogenase